jgi:hypothetical protein
MCGCIITHRGALVDHLTCGELFDVPENLFAHTVSFSLSLHCLMFSIKHLIK